VCAYFNNAGDEHFSIYFCYSIVSIPVSIFWFRRDLRLEDNAGLYYSLRSGNAVVPVFIFDTDILDDLQDKSDKRVAFIHDALMAMQRQLVEMGSSMHVLYGKPLQCFRQLMSVYNIQAVYTNHDYEPYAQERDGVITALLKSEGIVFHSYKDQVIFEKGEVVKDNKEPYTVYTPYSRKWKEHLNDFYLKPYPTGKYYNNFFRQDAVPVPTLEMMGFRAVSYDMAAAVLDESIARKYDETRDYPAIKGTTRLSVHLRFGTISIRKLAAEAKELNGQLLNELIWREFYQMILWHFPHVVSGSFRKEYDNIVWRNNEAEFKQWCKGETGYPIVDAGMRELNETGYMHNRARMIAASFLCKDLLTDWRWGEAYFAQKLLDYDLAANNGGWQWAAGTGCDAAPYFRVFNPTLQAEKFDPQQLYIKKWVPEYGTLSYRGPIVEHKAAKERCLAAYKKALSMKA